ncbi:hypothetical protein GGS20DRAFT_412436 [Poronia punctata]|nr:hypothetical protein GGS20DRAFT_412436 [Poronia punctata]
MVSLPTMRESNTRISQTLPPGLVAVFVGATSGIGEATLKHLAKNTRQPRIYFLGRRQTEGDRIKKELEEVNPGGEYHFLSYDLSLLKNVDDACRYIQGKEKAINLLFLTSGTLTKGRKTVEGLNYSIALGYFSRTRFIVDLLPQLRAAKSLRRVVTVLAGTKEGPILTDDFQANDAGIVAARGHQVSMVTSALKTIAQQAPEVSFVHDFPGFVETTLGREFTGFWAAVGNGVFNMLMPLLCMSTAEAGERHAFLATSARFPPRSRKGGDDDDDDDEGLGVPRGEDVDVAVSVDGDVGGGVYSVDYKAEGTDKRVRDVIKGLSDDGTVEKAWKYTEEEFLRITGSLAI